MTASLKLRTGGAVLVDALRNHGVETAFCVPGESYLAVLDALYDAQDEIRLIVARQDGGAAYMAEAYGKVTGKPGICFVTRGPGAANASIGVHAAHQDSTPMILFIGQVGSEFADREAFQEVDFRRMFSQMSKWVAQIDRADRIPEYVSRAFHTATSGRPGPVVLALPEDMLTSTVQTADAAPYRAVQAHPGDADMQQLRDLLAAARRPIVLLGGTVWDREACDDIRHFAEASGLPVACAWRYQDLFDNGHSQYIGDVGLGINPKLAQRVRESDLLVVIGARLGEMTTGGYTLIEAPRPKQKLVHVHAGAEELGRVHQSDLPINSSMKAFAAAAARLEPVDGSAWRQSVAAARQEYLDYNAKRALPGELDLWEVMKGLRERVPADTIITSGAGNFSAWAGRFYPYRSFRTQVATSSGAMGYGVPAGIAAQIAAKGRTVVSFNGDGDFLMNGQELATAVQYDLPIVFLVFNNGLYGTIRMHQEREYPGRVIGTGLRNPDFAALARAYGLHGETVRRTAEFAPALERALGADRAALIELIYDSEMITPNTTLEAIRAQAQRAR
ncbi:MAG: thiamine pyrophosphate-binding protein [Betaproteobacteria bacterium]|jgi:acetolactate synthase-1/2/3 large subunit|nr:thiamine pyrophosphate-binding protein [Betaproteobacteria bacterium]